MPRIKRIASTDDSRLARLRADLYAAQQDFRARSGHSTIAIPSASPSPVLPPIPNLKSDQEPAVLVELLDSLRSIRVLVENQGKRLQKIIDQKDQVMD